MPRDHNPTIIKPSGKKRGDSRKWAHPSGTGLHSLAMISRLSPAPVWPALFGLLALSSGAPAALAQPAPVPAAAKPASAVERLTHLARLWGAVRYLHPWLAYKEIDWDAALVQAIPRVRAARTAEQYAAAVQ